MGIYSVLSLPPLGGGQIEDCPSCPDMIVGTCGQYGQVMP